MSFAAAHESRLARRTCQLCRERKARFQYRGKVRADRDHVWCFECYRSGASRRAQLPAAARFPKLPVSPFGYTNNALTAAQCAHRRRMFDHLKTTANARGR